MKLMTFPAGTFRKRRRYTIIMLLFLSVLSGVVQQAEAQQCTPDPARFKNGEQVDYDIYFKWGLLFPKAGSATFKTTDTRLNGNRAWNYNLTFRTSGMFEKIYRMRDTLECYFSPEMKMLYSSKRTNEKNKYKVENINFRYRGNSVITHTHRFTMEDTKIDTVMTAIGCVYDMVGATMHLRSIDWKNLKIGDEFPVTVVIGRDHVNISYRYAGQAIVERGETIKYSTRYFIIDIYDEAFEVSKAAAEVWIGDDENHIPVKVRAKLKIGAAEVHYSSSKNLKHPLKSRVVIPRPSN